MQTGRALIVLLIAYLTDVGKGLSCRNDYDKPVDWFIGYKLHEVYDYVNIDSDAREITWTYSTQEIQKDGMMKYSFEEAFKMNSRPNSTFIMYNDEKPHRHENFTSNKKYWWAHMKGIFAFDDTDNGLWIIHSIPKLSMKNDSYEYPATGEMYGQHMLCLTLSRDALPEIVNMLLISRPLVQGHWVSEEVADLYPNIKLLVGDSKYIPKFKSKVKDFSEFSDRLNLRYFTKSKYYGKDLYADLVAPNLESSLLVESWRHGEGLLPSACHTEYQVENIENLSWKIFGQKISLKTTDDHAKWAVTVHDDLTLIKRNNATNHFKKWICLGDINRANSQKSRGGGTMCIQNGHLWNLFYQLVTKVESCNK